MNFKVRKLDDFIELELSCMKMDNVTKGKEVYQYAVCKFLTDKGYKWIKFTNQYTQLEAGKSYLLKGIIVPEYKNGFENLTFKQVSVIREIPTHNKPIIDEINPVSK